MVKSDPISLLGSFFPYSAQDFAAHNFAPDAGLELFLENGWLISRGYPAAVVCDVCDDSHFADVIHDNDGAYAVCLRSAERFRVAVDAKLYRFDDIAVVESLASALQLDGPIRPLNGFSSLFTIGGSRIHGTRVNFFFTPDLYRLDLANSIIEAVSKQSRSITAALIVASDASDQINLAASQPRVVRLRDIAQLEAKSGFVVDQLLLAKMVLPADVLRNPLGAPARQRDKIIPILEALKREGKLIDTSRSTCRMVVSRYQAHYNDQRSPSPNTIKSAIRHWQGIP